MSDQQRQTQEYFRNAAAEWQNKSVQAEKGRGVIADRKQAVLTTIEQMDSPKSLLDVGCGSGQLVIASAGLGLESIGIDFAEEMIQQCETNAREAGIEAKFICKSFFDMPVEENRYDIISAQGFIEYISLEELHEFFVRAHTMLKPGGALLVGSRNRLLNALSLNAFTEFEMEMGTINQLLAEAIVFNGMENQEALFDTLKSHERIDPQPDKKHPTTFVTVDFRYQFTPADLICRTRKLGFTPHTIHAVNFHPMSPSLRGTFPRLHDEVATFMSQYAHLDPRLVPSSSTFVLDLRKNA
ncbi:class I SAM-dependent methyltransferase [Magnetovibrio sp.]|uniref:class I SAM-dependent methyltransferase n=1 Tax=Magnetovibrio sp. TaxID=2024836 RepID=UPI002F922A7F